MNLNRMKQNWDRSVGWGQRRVSNWRPRLSLSGGSMMVLLTLGMTIAYDACGPERTGYEFLVLGEGDWPSLMGLLSDAAGRLVS